MTSNNPAAAQGWVKSADPKTGRVFYANHITRKTQWDPPDGWVDEVKAPTAPPPMPDEKEEPLPSNWEVMHDPTTGKPFYVDHERKITTWTRPKPEKKQEPVSLRPAVASTPTASENSSAALARILSQQNRSSSSRSYHQEASYYSQPASTHDVDLSDSLPALDFSVKKVADALRPNCPHCDALFTVSKRRHHCRLCGDVFCDTCSSHRATLPLEGPEFEKPVRICDFCNKDVEQGNFFSMRRYLTPLHLYNPEAEMEEEEGGVATSNNVNAALSALTLDLDQMVQNPGALEEKVTIPPEILVPEIAKHLKQRSTADRAIRAIASLLALESINGKQDFATAVYLYGKRAVFEDILMLLERSGSDRKTLYVQEQAARVIFYLTESRTVTAVVRKQSELQGGYYDDDGKEQSYGGVESLDIHRAVRNVLDHSSSTKNPNLQRWSAACIKNLVLEDQRRACLAVNDLAAQVASGENPSSLEYESFMDELVSSGGVMILSSLVGTDDSDTRAHAVGALGALLISTRAIDASMSTLAEMTGGEAGRTTTKDGDIVRAIVAGGGCASSVSQLLLSADNGVAGMGCHFLSSLVMPLLSNPAACGSLPAEYDFRRDQDGMGACREAAVEIATGSCLPALMSLARENKRASRSIELRKVAMETLAAVALSVGEMGKAWAHGQYEEGLEQSGAPSKLKDAILLLNEEGVIDVSLEVLQSSAGQSLGSSNETPSSRLRESAGIVLGALTSCSAEAIMELQTRQILSALLVASDDSSMTLPSTLRGDAAPRCLGVVETAASILMFAWQHPSGASSELLDRLIEVIDAGVIPYLSKVINMKIDWETKDKAVGGMKGRIASCRFLCCLFGIALTDDTGIGMRRLMDAVDGDARAYRGGERSPSNIIEAALGVLQTASNHARKALMGSTSHGAHYQAALMDLVDASLLAAGSMCGSSVAPGGSEGTFITGENFLKQRTDQYVSRRTEICRVACDVVVRGGRSGPALLPTMLVGGFGEGACLASLRLSLAIAQNGTKDQHAKLALSGILVPISDSLRTALSSGDLYKFSAALALVRFCGPHVAAGQGGGIESVRNAIRVATNVLVLPINPDASIEQLETQESLKSECIAALESLSRNASLWSAISTDALPSIVQYLHSTVGSGSQNARYQGTRSAALRAVLQIVQVPSHAVSAAEGGLAEPLCKLLQTADGKSEEDEVPMLALEVLHVLASNEEARRKARFLDTGLARSICAALGKSTTEKPKKPSDSRADVTFLGLEILSAILSDVEGEASAHEVLQSSGAIALLDAVSSEPAFVRAMCSSLLLKTNMKLPRHDAESSGEEEFDVPKLYGPPLILVQEKCAGHADTHQASAALLYTVSLYACAIESRRSDAFWKTFMLEDLPGNPDPDDCVRVAATLCAHFLALLTVDFEPFVPSDSRKKEEYESLTRPLVRHRLLEGLRDSMDTLAGETSYGRNEDTYMISVLVKFNVPHICLSLWKDPALLDLAFEVIKQIVEQEPDEVLHLFVEGKAAIMSLFDLLNIDSTVGTSENISEIRRFLASILGQLAENGLLADAVERFDVRSSAIAALAAACLGEEERPADDDEDMTSNRLSSVLMGCLVQLCTVKDKTDAAGKKRIQLSAAEAEALSRNLGKKICHMVLSRFLERAKLQQYEIDEDEDIMDAPDVAMLCAMAQHDEALKTLRSIGGLNALSLVAAEGEISAIVALKKACEGDANVLLEGDTYQAIMTLLSDENPDAAWRSDDSTRRDLEEAAFGLLARLCSGSAKGRNAVAAADHCEDCISRAIEVVSSLAGLEDESGLETTQEQESSDTDSDAEENEREDFEDAPEDSTPAAKGAHEHEKQKLPDSQDQAVGVAACLFLSAIAATKTGRKALVENPRSVKALSYLASGTSSAEPRYAALKAVASLAPYATSEGALSTEELSDVLIAALTSEEKIKATADLNSNLMVDTAVAGIIVIFDCLSAEKQHTIGAAVCARFTKCVKSCVVTRATTRELERAHSAELAYSLTATLLLARGKDLDGIYSQDLLISMLHLLQWRHDPKTSLGSTNLVAWDAAITNCLLILSFMLWRPEEVLVRESIDLNALASTTLMLARPGKAPRKAIDLRSALGRIREGQDSAARVAAERITDRLFD